MCESSRAARGLLLRGFEIPELEIPEAAAPGIGALAAAVPGADTPGIEAPGDDFPGIVVPGVDVPGAGGFPVLPPGLGGRCGSRAETPGVPRRAGAMPHSADAAHAPKALDLPLHLPLPLLPPRSGAVSRTRPGTGAGAEG